MKKLTDRHTTYVCRSYESYTSNNSVMYNNFGYFKVENSKILLVDKSTKFGSIVEYHCDPG